MNLNEKINSINTITNEIIKKQKEIEDLVSKRVDTYHEISNFIKENCKYEILKSRKIYTINQDPDYGACLNEDHKFDLETIIGDAKIMNIRDYNKLKYFDITLLFDDEDYIYHIHKEYDNCYFYENYLFIFTPAQYEGKREWIEVFIFEAKSKDILDKLKLELSL